MAILDTNRGDIHFLKQFSTLPCATVCIGFIYLFSICNYLYFCATPSYGLIADLFDEKVSPMFA